MHRAFPPPTFFEPPSELGRWLDWLPCGFSVSGEDRVGDGFCHATFRFIVRFLLFVPSLVG